MQTAYPERYFGTECLFNEPIFKCFVAPFETFGMQIGEIIITFWCVSEKGDFEKRLFLNGVRVVVTILIILYSLSMNS